jgi:hypothetical protein
MRQILACTVLAAAVGLGPVCAQTVPVRTMTLGTVRIPRLVKADDQPLNAGTYVVRLTGEALAPATGETPNLEQRVEFLQAGIVKGKAVASIVPPDQIGQVAQEPVPEPGTARVETLKGEEYVRVWINKDGMSYLIYLPIPL